MALLCLRRGDDSYDGVSSFLFINVKQNENRTVVDAVVSWTRKFGGVWPVTESVWFWGEEDLLSLVLMQKNPVCSQKVLLFSEHRFANLLLRMGLDWELGCLVVEYVYYHQFLNRRQKKQNSEQYENRRWRSAKWVSLDMRPSHFELLTDLHKGLRIRWGQIVARARLSKLIMWTSVLVFRAVGYWSLSWQWGIATCHLNTKYLHELEQAIQPLWGSAFSV